MAIQPRVVTYLIWLLEPECCFRHLWDEGLYWLIHIAAEKDPITMSTIQPGMPSQAVRPHAGSTPEVSGSPTQHDHPPTLSPGWMSHRTDRGLKEAMAASHGFGNRDQHLATQAFTYINAGDLQLNPEKSQGEVGCYELKDREGNTPKDDFTLHTNKSKDAPYDIVDIKENGKGLSRPLIRPDGDTPMNSNGHCDVQLTIADHLPAKDLVSLARTNKFHAGFFKPEIENRKNYPSQADQMVVLYRLPQDQRQAAATNFPDSIKSLRAGDSDSRDEALLNLSHYFNMIPAGNDRQQLARRFLSELPDLPSSEQLARTVQNVRPDWLPMEERQHMMNNIVFPIMDRLINDGAMPNTPGNPIRDIWTQLTLLPTDMQAEAKSKIDAMVDAMSARGTPMPQLPWEYSGRPDLSIQAR